MIFVLCGSLSVWSVLSSLPRPIMFRPRAAFLFSISSFPSLNFEASHICINSDRGVGQVSTDECFITALLFTSRMDCGYWDIVDDEPDWIIYWLHKPMHSGPLIHPSSNAHPPRHPKLIPLCHPIPSVPHAPKLEVQLDSVEQAALFAIHARLRSLSRAEVFGRKQEVVRILYSSAVAVAIPIQVPPAASALPHVIVRGEAARTADGGPQVVKPVAS